MRDVFNLPADIVPDEANKCLEVRLHSMASPRANRALYALCELLNQDDIAYPGTRLRLVYQAPELHKK